MTLAIERRLSVQLPTQERKPAAQVVVSRQRAPEQSQKEIRVIQSRPDIGALDRAAREYALFSPPPGKTRADVKRAPDDPAHAVRRREKVEQARRLAEWAKSESPHLRLWREATLVAAGGVLKQDRQEGNKQTYPPISTIDLSRSIESKPSLLEKVRQFRGRKPHHSFVFAAR